MSATVSLWMLTLNCHIVQIRGGFYNTHQFLTALFQHLLEEVTIKCLQPHFIIMCVDIIGALLCDQVAKKLKVTLKLAMC